tara:strand:- start:139 stop:366 length:228 start_codon:yes stop_codon:yes gene_type:complete
MEMTIAENISDSIHILIIIGFTLFLGACIGSIGMLVFIQKRSKDLSKELDKFRSLYFNEVDKWKNKYTKDDYEAY